MTSRIFILTLILLAFCAIPNLNGGTILLSAPPSVTTGSLFTIHVDVSDVVDLASYQFDIGYNPLLVTGISVTEGPFLATARPTVFIPGSIDNASGLISLTAGTLTGLGPGVTGSGTLVDIQFSALSAGTATLSILSPLLFDSGLNPINVLISNASVDIGGAAVPEPTTGLLILLGLGTGAAVRRAQRQLKR